MTTLHVPRNSRLWTSCCLVDYWDQASLPVSCGGIGVRKATVVSLPAFIASVAGSQNLVRQLLPSRLHKSSGTDSDMFFLALSEWQNKSSLSPIVTAPFSSSQETWDTPLVKVTRDRLMSAAPSQSAKARRANLCTSRLHLLTVLVLTAWAVAKLLDVGHATAQSVTSSSEHWQQRMLHLDWSRQPTASAQTIWLSCLGKKAAVLYGTSHAQTFAVSHLSRTVTGPWAVATEAEAKKVSQLSATYYFVPSPSKRQELSMCRRLTFCVKSIDESLQLPTNHALRTSFRSVSVRVAVQRSYAACVLGCTNDGSDVDFIHWHCVLITVFCSY